MVNFTGSVITREWDDRAPAPPCEHCRILGAATGSTDFVDFGILRRRRAGLASASVQLDDVLAVCRASLSSAGRELFAESLKTRSTKNAAAACSASTSRASTSTRRTQGV